MPTQEKLTVVCFNEGSKRVAQCLEYDIVGVSDTTEDAFKELMLSIISRIAFAKEHNISNPFAGIPKAPKKHQEKLKVATRLQLKPPAPKRAKSTYKVPSVAAYAL